MNPEDFGVLGRRSKFGQSRFPMGKPTPDRIKGLRAIVRQPKRGPMGEYVKSLARVELIAHRMAGRIK